MSKTKKIISVVLVATLVMAMATVAMISASAATTVYFENSEGWSEVYAYVWGGLGGEELGAWPGSPCTLVDGDLVWSADIPDDCTNVIFNNGGNGAQTNNLVNQGGGYIAKLGDGTETGEFGETKTVYVWEEYADAPVETEPTTAAPVETEATTAAPVVTEPATDAPVVTEPVATEPTEAPVVTEPATEDEPATDDEPVVTEPTEAPVVTEPATDAPVVTEPATDAPVVTEPATDAPVVTEPAAKNVIVIDGVEYEVKVGDVITYTSTLTTPDFIENIQGSTTFDASKLTLIDATAAERFPNINGVVTNVKDGVVYFNASEIATGYDFVGGKVLVTLQFEVTDASYSEITTVIEEMCKLGGDDFITGSEIVADGVAVAETLTVKTEEPTTPDTQPTTGAPIATEPTTAEKTDATSTTDKPAEKPDAPITGASATIYVVLAVLALAAAAVVVLRKKVNG